MILTQFEKYHLFRRLVIVYLLILYSYVTIESFNVAYHCIDKSVSASDIAIIIASLTALMTLLISSAFKMYSNSRDAKNG